MRTPSGMPDVRVPILHVGSTVAGKYRIKRVLGHGGMGSVYKAENVTIGKTVALKVMHPHLADDEITLARFQREARATAKVKHPQVVEVLDMGVEPSGAPFLVMEYVRGKSLARAIRDEAPFEFDRAARIAGQMLGGLEAVHAQGVVHRDLKPDNVQLTVDRGEADFVKIFDFGISTFTEAANTPKGGRDLTPSGRTMGTPYYSSPEQLLGASGRDQRVDLYAVGVMLYEMLCAERPYRASNFADLCRSILQDPMPPTKLFRQGVPEGLERVLERALAKEPDNRFGTAGAMNAALVPYGAASLEADEAEPTDTFVIDLRELRLRERHAPIEQTTGARAALSGRFLAAMRSFFKRRLGERKMAQVLAGARPEVHAWFVGPFDPSAWYPTSLVDVFDLADEQFAAGDRMLVVEGGRAVGESLLRTGMIQAQSPEVFLGQAGELWSALFDDGQPKPPKLGRGYGLFEVHELDSPRVSTSVAFLGVLEAGLRRAGAADVEVRLSRAAALGDGRDAFEASWSV